MSARVDLVAGSLERRLEAAMTVVAYVVVRDGPAYMPLFYRLETELQALRRKSDPISRVNSHLAAYTVESSLKAIR
ncbi:hypothetical protein [uncultured Enterovirga sp.]|uniref:hypothetical protein n=1 Tax=uncultured Enterovirga sp. TaxID=2026352 RepID=UPI0035CBE237